MHCKIWPQPTSCQLHPFSHNNQMFLNIAKCPRGGKSSVVRTTELGLGNTSLEKTSPFPLPVCLLSTVPYYNCLYTHLPPHRSTTKPPAELIPLNRCTSNADGWMVARLCESMHGWFMVGCMDKWIDEMSEF